MLAVSNVCDAYVAIAHVRALHATRSEAARTSYNARVCLRVHYALTAFYFCWGIIYPTIVYFYLHNSWGRMRSGLVVDACAFLLGYAVLHAHGETRYPPGEAPLEIALFGRPACALLGAALFTPSTRLKLSGWGEAAGLFHVKLSLSELRRADLYSVLRGSGVDGPPVACGNSAITCETSEATPSLAGGL